MQYEQLFFSFTPREGKPMSPRGKASKSFFGSGKEIEGPETYAIWQAVDAQKLVHLVVVAVRSGGGVLAGSTRDGSAATLRLYKGDEAETFYAGDAETLNDLIEFWAGAYEGELEARQTD